MSMVMDSGSDVVTLDLQAACWSIETTGPELERCVINLPSRQVPLMSSGPEETIYWMEVRPQKKVGFDPTTIS
jgi:hypothetical protein